ncbi:MAG: redoxin domain-containing protein [Phycisphaerales bacterium]|nr:redoxin domain-containing protein [Phycisphaerales bacterium]
MRFKIPVALAAALARLAGAQPTAAQAQPAALGQPAPMIEVQEWLSGEPVAAWEPGRVYVIDFWATWCRPCLEAVPHMNALAAEYGDRPVTFIGLSSPDSRGNSLERTRQFVQQGVPGRAGQPVLMEYPIAWARGRTTWQRYAQAGWDQSIPHVFVVDGEGRLAWHGHPAEMDDALGEVVAGTFDSAAYAEAEARRAELKARVAPLTREMTAKFRAGDVKGAIDLAGEITELDPVLFANIGAWRYERLVQSGRAEEGGAFVTGLLDGAWKDSASALYLFAFRVSGGPDRGDLGLALRAAERANEVTKGRRLSVLELLATLYAASDDLERARGAVEAALKVAPEGEREALRTRLIELGGTPPAEAPAPEGTPRPEEAPPEGGG